MSRQYPIWNEVTNCKYQSSKSYGNQETGNVTIYVGSSSSNSTEFLSHRVTKREKVINGKDVIVFKFSVDDVVIKEMIFENKKGKAGKLLKVNSKLKRIKSL